MFDGRFYSKEFTGNASNSIVINEQLAKIIGTGSPFDFSFLDEDYDRLYRSEQQMGKIFNYFALLAIFISCLGLFGLASFTKKIK